MATKREKTKYPGVYYRLQERFDGYGREKAYYVLYRRGGRGAKLIEEPVGRESEGMTAAKANLIRAVRIAGKEQSNTERRAAEEAARLADESRWPLNRIWEAYKAAHPEHKGRDRDESRWNVYLRSRLGDRLPEELETADIDAFKSAVLKTGRKPGTVQRVITLLRAVLHFGAERGYCPPLDPSRLRIKSLHVDDQKTEVMTDDQLARYLAALDEEADQDAAAFIRLALVTGMRKGALLALQWNDCDFERGILTLRGEAAKKGKTEYLPMTAATRAILEGVRRTESPYVFPGRNGGKRQDFRRMAWRVKKKAGLPEDFRPLHGLRHNFASRLASSGQVDMYTLQKLLTHESPQMTQRYAHLRDEALRRAASLADSLVLQKSEKGAAQHFDTQGKIAKENEKMKEK